MITLATAEKALKEVYLDVVSDQLNTTVNPLLARLEKTARDVYGNNINKLVPYGLSGGIGAGSEDGDLPKAMGNKYARFTASLKNLYGTIEITDKAIRASSNNEGAFVNLLTAEMEGLLKASRINLGRMLYGDGSGKLADIASNTENTLIVIDAQYLMPGMIVDIYSDAVCSASGRQILSVTEKSDGTFSVTIDGTTLSTLTGTSIGIYLQNSYQNEITGLGAIFSSTGSLYGISKSSNSWLIPYSSDIDGSLSESDILTALDELEIRGSAPNLIICSMGVRRALINILNTNKRYYDTLNLEGGFKAISYNGIPVIADRFCPSGCMYILNTDDFHLHQLCDWRWLESEDGRILRQKADKPVYTATLVKYAELICDRPSGQALLYGISEA